MWLTVVRRRLITSVKHLSQGGDWTALTCASRPQCPVFRREADGTETPEPFAAEAKFFTESRLLQRDVQIILESCPNQIILGTILHPVQPESRRHQHLLFRCGLIFLFCVRTATSRSCC